MIGSIAGLSFARLLGSALQAASLIVLARSTTLGEFGLTNTILSVSAIVMVLADLGLGTLLLKVRAQTTDLVPAALRANTLSTGLVGLLGAAGTFAFITVTNSDLVAICIIPLALAIEKNFDTSSAVPIADGRIALISTGIVLRRAVSLGVMLFLMFAGAPTALSFSVGLLFGAIASQLLLRISRALPSASSSLSEVVLAVRAGAPYLVSNTASQARQLDVPIVQAILGATAAGLYAGPSRLIGPFMLAAISAANVILPRVATTGRATKRLVRSLGAITVALAIVAIPAALISPAVIVLLFGAQFSAASEATMLLVLALPFVAMSTPMGAALQGVGRARYVASNGLVFAVVFVVLALLGASTLGINGVALAMLLSYFSKCVSLMSVLFAEVRHGSD